MTLRKISRMGIVIALYVGLTYAFSFMSYQGIQFRIAEVLILLVFFKKDYALPLILACAIANIPSPLGLLDVGIGTAATALAVLGILLIRMIRNHFPRPWVALGVASLFPVFSNAFLVGWELHIALDLPFWPSVLGVGIGEFSVVTVFGVLLFTLLSRNRTFSRLVFSDEPFRSWEE
jgi:uncharacterized membrane protein